MKLCVFFCFFVLVSCAQNKPDTTLLSDTKTVQENTSDSKPHDPLEEKLFSPSLVMEHQKEIGLEENQRQQIIEIIQSIQQEMVPLQWEMQEAAKTLAMLIGKSKVDEEKALLQAETLMHFETKTKRTHLKSLIQVKNVLTEEQQKKLTRLRAKETR